MTVNSIGVTDNIKRETYNKPARELVKIREYNDFEERIYKKDATREAKFITTASSAIIPGLGQAINGDWKKAIALFSVGFVIPTVITSTKLAEKKFALVGATVVNLATKIISAIDAYKHAKSEFSEYIPKTSQKTEK